MHQASRGLGWARARCPCPSRRWTHEAGQAWQPWGRAAAWPVQQRGRGPRGSRPVALRQTLGRMQADRTSTQAGSVA